MQEIFWGYILACYMIYGGIKMYVMESGRSWIWCNVWYIVFTMFTIRLYTKGFSLEAMSIAFYHDEIPLWIRISQVGLCVLILVNKVLLMLLGLDDYIAFSDERHKTRVE